MREAVYRAMEMAEKVGAAPAPAPEAAVAAEEAAAAAALAAAAKRGAALSPAHEAAAAEEVASAPAMAAEASTSTKCISCSVKVKVARHDVDVVVEAGEVVVGSLDEVEEAGKRERRVSDQQCT